jgi:IS5 family transposase
MQKQPTFSDVEYGARKRISRREILLDTMEGLVPWGKLVSLIRRRYFSGKRGRPPKGIETMLRMYFLPIWYDLADEALEEAVYDSYAMRKFMKINFLEESVPDATTLLKFRHLLEKHGLQEKILEAVNEMTERRGS